MESDKIKFKNLKGNLMNVLLPVSDIPFSKSCDDISYFFLFVTILTLEYLIYATRESTVRTITVT
jgi:hypothetical protein